MELHIFRTNISSKKKVKSIGVYLNAHEQVLNWNVDLQDVDKVLRIEAENHSSERELIRFIERYGFQVEPLPD